MCRYGVMGESGSGGTVGGIQYFLEAKEAVYFGSVGGNHTIIIHIHRNIDPTPIEVMNTMN